METNFRTKVVKVAIPDNINIIFGQSHFIKTVDDLFEAMVTSSPTIKFGLAFCEASQQRLVRTDGNDADLIKLAEKAAFDIGCGHIFLIFMKDGYPINVLNRIKNVEEVCRIFCATANSLEVIVAETEQGRGVLGVIDGQSPMGIEGNEDRIRRTEFLKNIGYKR